MATTKFKGPLKQVVDEAIARGWSIAPTKKGHYLMRHHNPNVGLVTVSGTPGDSKAWKSVKGDLVRQEKLAVAA